MKLLREHIIFRALIFVLIAALSTPYFVKFAHIFTHHKHEICLGEKTTHLHKLDSDCEFYKFKLTTNFSCDLSNYELFLEKKESQQIVSLYYLLSKHQSLHFSLRGPPSLV